MLIAQNGDLLGGEEPLVVNGEDWHIAYSLFFPFRQNGV